MRKEIIGMLALIVLISVTVTFANGQLCPGMVSYWKFDEGSGTTASDSVDANHGTIHGATWTTGIVGGAVSFDGLDDFVDCGNDTSLDLQNLTLEAWAKVEGYTWSGLTDDYAMIIGKGAWRQYWIYFFHNVTYPNSLWFGGRATATSYLGEVGANNVVELGSWHHVVGTFDGTYLKVYIDGELVDCDTDYDVESCICTPVSGNLHVTDVPLTIGKISHPSFPGYFWGTIDEVAIYNRALTPEEIQQHYQNSLSGSGYCEEVPLAVTIDIKPGSDPNCFNNDGNGVIPVAILGSADLDVTKIDASTVQLEGMAVKVVGKSSRLLAHIEDVNKDGFDDLVVKIEDIDGIFSPGETTATLTGNLSDGPAFEGADSICIVGSPTPAPRLNTRSKLTTTWASIKAQH
jgi:hypothetical protein